MINHDYADVWSVRGVLRKRTIILWRRRATEAVMALIIAVLPYALLYWVDIY